ncbi:unnamed protein product [Amaranthus hypochondriacus]
MPVSETEKHGVSQPGSSFGDKVEYVPIKKRRFLLRSPSPPAVKASPCVEETENQTKVQDVSSKLVSSNVVLSQMVGDNASRDAKKSDEFNVRFGEEEDFSGISILAAAACSSSLGRDCGYAEDGLGIEESSVLEQAREGFVNTEARSSFKGLSKEDIPNSSEMSSGATSSCISTEPIGELASISTTENSSQKAVTFGKAFLGVDSLTLSNDISCSKDEEISRNQRPPSRDKRLHWDLNVMMDAWDQPFDDPIAQNEVAYSISEDSDKLNHDYNKESGVYNLQDNLETASRSCVLPDQPRTVANQSKDNHGVDVCLNLKHPPLLDNKCLSSNSSLNFDVIKCKVEDTKRKLQGEAAPDEATQRLGSCKMDEDGAACLKSLNLNEERIDHQSVMENVGVSCCDLNNLGKACPSDATFGAVSADTQIGLYVSSSSDANPNVSVSKDLETHDILHHEGNSLAENADSKAVDMQHVAEFSISDDNGLPFFDTSNSAHERFFKTGIDAAGELQEDYDSQYEDGELRESSGRAWEEFDREAENVDYFSDRETYDVSPSNSEQVDNGKSATREFAGAMSSRDCNMNNEDYRKGSETVGDGRGHDEGDKLNLSHAVEKVELSQGKELLESNKNFSDVVTRLDDNGGKDKRPSQIDVSLDSKVTDSRVEPRAFGRGLQSQIERSVGREDTYREEQFRKTQSRFESGSMRSFDRVRYSYNNQLRGRQGDIWDGSSGSRRGFRRHYSPIVRGRFKLNDDAIEVRDDLGCADAQNDTSYSLQILPRTRVGAEEEPCTEFNSRYKAERKFSPDRGCGFGRGRPFRYGPFGENRGGRGRYRPSPDETFQSSLKYRRPLSRREKSLSPFTGRGQSNLHLSRRKSPSCSRSRSPVVWNSPRRRLGAGSGTFLRQRSRSPNFRSEARLQRQRSPHQEPGFGVDNAGGFRSISRNHGSPPRNRWSAVRKDELGQFREVGYRQRTSALEKSPGRIRLRGDRASALDSPRNLKPDGFYRISDDAGRGVGYEGNNEERRKPYNFFRSARRNYDDGMASRLHQHNNDSLSMENSFRDRDASSFQDRGLRSIENRVDDLPRRFRGVNRSFVYERDGNSNHISKQFGNQSFVYEREGKANHNSSHNLRSEEQYRPSYIGTYSDNGGANRGCRYEHFENRRKQYSPTNFMRRNDNEDTDKGSNVDESVDNTQEFCGRVTRGFDGQIDSARFREDKEPVLCEQEEKLDDNSLPVGVTNSGGNSAVNVIIPSQP